MTRAGAGVVGFAAACLLLLCSGCTGSEAEYTAPPAPTPQPQFAACMSMMPVDAGDPNEPVITLIGPRVISHPLGVPYVDAGATAADPRDGDITSQIVVTVANAAGLIGPLDGNTAGDYLIRYNVVDNARLPALEVVRLVRVNAGTFRAQTARDLQTTGAHLAYYEHLPVNYTADPAQKFPLIIFQHGWGGARFSPDGTTVQPGFGSPQGDLAGLIASGLWDDSRPFIVLSPQRCIEPEIDDYTSLATRLFILYAINTYKIDPSRIYMFGYSAGSCLTWSYIHHYPHQLAAAVPMSGSWSGTYTVLGCACRHAGLGLSGGRRSGRPLPIPSRHREAHQFL